MEGRDLETKFRDFLLEEKCYPKDSLVENAWIANKNQGWGHQTDIAVIDLSRNEFVALFEVKATRDHSALRNAASRLLENRRVLEKNNIPLFLVFPSLTKPETDFEISQVISSDVSENVSLSDLPSYEALIGADTSSQKIANKLKVKATVDRFKIVSFLLAALVVLALFADITNILTLNGKQLSMAAVAIGLVLLPYAAKIKMLGVEFERLNYKTKDNVEL